MKKTLFLALASLSICSAWSIDPLPHPLQVKDSFCRAGIEGKNTAIFMKIENMGKSEEILLSATASTLDGKPLADRTELHSHMRVGDVMKMTKVEKMILKPGLTELKPGGDHIMPMQLVATIKEGDKIKLKLVFKKAPPLEIIIPVVAMGAKMARKATANTISTPQ